MPSFSTSAQEVGLPLKPNWKGLSRQLCVDEDDESDNDESDEVNDKFDDDDDDDDDRALM